jgi:signal transduction histidine kinase
MTTTPPAAAESGRGRHRLTVRGWFGLVLAVMAVLLIVCTVVGGLLLNRTTQLAEQLTDRISPARVEAARLQSALVDQETGVRGYLLTGDREFLEPYTAGVVAEKQEADLITALVGDQPQLIADVTALRRAAGDWRRIYAEPHIAGPPTRHAADNVQAQAGKRAFDHVRVLFAAENDHYTQARERARAQLSRVEGTRNVTFAVMLAIILLSGIAVSVLLQRTVIRPLEALRTTSRRVALGDFAHHIDAGGPADIREVAAAVEGMRRRIVTDLDSAQAQQATLTRQAADLDAQATELRRSNAELEQFAYVASHDLQEPLRKIATFCQLIEKRYGDRLDERGGQYVTFAVDGAKRMQTLINDLLTFSRVGRLHDNREPVALDQAVSTAVTNLAASIEETDAQLERPPDLPTVIGDHTVLTMLWQNLIGNAVKFRRPDEVPRIRIDCEREEDTGGWRFSVTDNGIGIPAEFHEKVFVIFQRLHSRDAYSGTGIGLALCKKIVEYHGGRIWLENPDDGGTRVCFTLPAVPTADQAQVSPTTEEGISA